MTKLHYANTKDTDMWYAVPHSIPDPFFYLEHGTKRLVFLNQLEIDAFREANVEGVTAVPFEKLVASARKNSNGPVTAGQLALAVIDEYAEGVRGISVSRTFPLDVADEMRASGVSLTVDKQLFPERLLKTPLEMHHIKDAIVATEATYEMLSAILAESSIVGEELWYGATALTSEMLQHKAELFLFERGYECSEGLIISSGEHTAFPHHHGKGPLMPNVPIIIDLYPRSRKTKYFADMTRTYVKGEPTEEVKKMYEAVTAAHDAAIADLRPGMKSSDVYAVAVAVLRRLGFEAGDKGFIHSLGHGVGLDIHEKPNLSPRSEEVLVEGMVVTIEPGLYYPGIGGVRIENMVQIASGRIEMLTSSSASSKWKL